MGVYNFSAGPAKIPRIVLEQVKNELLDFQGRGYSLLETSHRSALYGKVHEQTLELLREVYAVPANYSIIFCTGGATQQFAMLVDNFLSRGGKAAYVTTGSWGAKALTDAQIRGRIYPKVDIVEYYRPPRFTTLPPLDVLKQGTYKANSPKSHSPKSNAADPIYAHITTNETIDGVQYSQYPQSAIPLVADCSSDLLSKPLDFDQFAMVYGGAQKNLGPAGVTIVIIRDDLLSRASDELPPAYSYKNFVAKNSLYNTPPVFAIWLVKLVLEHIKEQGGLSSVQNNNAQKAKAIYDIIDLLPHFYHCPVETECRSVMNIVFSLPDEQRDSAFFAEAESNGLVGLRGHRSVGGFRASLYNAMDMEGARALADFMKDFARRHA